MLQQVALLLIQLEVTSLCTNFQVTKGKEPNGFNRYKKKKRRLKPDVIPTIFHRVPAAAMQTREAQMRPSSTSVTGESLPKKKRGAVEKRERAKVRNRLYINEIYRS